MVEGGMKCVKFLVFIFNVLFLISGLVLVSLGGTVIGVYSDNLAMYGRDGLVAPVLLVVVGAVTFLVAFLGCCGAVRENHCMTMSFAVVLALILVLELAAGLAAFVKRHDVRQTLQQTLTNSLAKYNMTGSVGLSQNLDTLQSSLQCCGVSGFEDWRNTTFSRETGGVPDSCCKEKLPACGQNVFTNANANDTINTRGCLVFMESQVKGNMATVIGAVFGFAFLQILGIVLACMLARNIKKEYETV